MINLPKVIPATFLCLLCLQLCSVRLVAQDILIEDATDNKDKVKWQWRVSVGETAFDKPVTAEFRIKNISDKPLIINDVLVGCHCTVVEFPKEAIEPNTEVSIKATFDAKREGRFYKLIRVYTNFDPTRAIMLAMEGTVKARHH
jgi:Protein of unknown function (DUF1573)